MIVLWLAALVLLSPSSALPQNSLKSLETLIIKAQGGRHRFSVEIADTGPRQARGLMFRRDLPRDQGMLFLYRTETAMAMWMKNTYLPLDMLFIAGDGRIVHIVERTVPLSTQLIGSNGPAAAVLEVVGGTVSRLGIALGDRVIHPAFDKNR